MASLGDRVDAWEIRRREDGAFAVYDVHGMPAGPFGTKEAAMLAARTSTSDGKSPEGPRSQADRWRGA